MNKLIKIVEEHYIVVDDSEIQEGDWIFNYSGVKYNEQVISQANKNTVINWKDNLHINDGTKSIRDCVKKITYSTEPLEGHDYLWRPIVKPISLTEIEEAINGYSVEKLARVHRVSLNDDWSKSSYLVGFKAHQELTKDKLFTADDMIKFAIDCYNDNYGTDMSFDGRAKINIQSLLPKTEWSVKFNEHGKLELL
jgi:hypothetical protein